MPRQNNNAWAALSPFPIIVRVHASRTAYSFVLTARTRGEERIISFGSKRLGKPQQKWSATKLELGAIRYAVRSNAQLLDVNDFVIECDSGPMRKLFSQGLFSHA